ncbi:MAG: hypothetical protein AAGD01_17015 [Acidobacteriota bacterium]
MIRPVARQARPSAFWLQNLRTLGAVAFALALVAPSAGSAEAIIDPEPLPAPVNASTSISAAASIDTATAVTSSVAAAIATPAAIDPEESEVLADEAAWLDAVEVFERLKSLEGTWQAHFIDADAPSFTVTYQLSARGTVLIETSHPGAHIEMKTIFLLADGELQAQHLCAFGNQPKMNLDRSRGNGYDLYFNHVGGSNLASEDAMWMRLDRLSLFNEDYFETEWSTFKGSEPFGPAQGIGMVRMD